jgi:adenylate cyclase
MGPACVECHNSHPESPKRDWKVGDVRGIQEVTITSPFAESLLSFKYLLLYFIFSVVAGSVLVLLYQRQVARIRLNPQPNVAA